MLVLLTLYIIKAKSAFRAKPTDKKQSNADRLGFASIRAEPLRSFVLSIHLTRYNATYKPWGFVPTRRASTLAKKQSVQKTNAILIFGIYNQKKVILSVRLSPEPLIFLLK
ncbi:hypothetical protein ABB10_03090 [Bacillus thuringiensis]|nr:hypothetical protein [Bacillus thuringiensis]MBH0351265.1 hypothetical protein [Bacillus thuringiensis]